MSHINNGYQMLSTTGAGIVLSTGAIYFGGFIRGSDLAGTLTIKNAASTILVASADRSLSLSTPVVITGGPITMTSSAGDHFVVMFRDVPGSV